MTERLWWKAEPPPYMRNGKHANLTIWDRNALHGLMGHCAWNCVDLTGKIYDEAETLYLRFRDRNKRQSENLAYEWASMRPMLHCFTSLALEAWQTVIDIEKHQPKTETRAEVLDFIRERLARQYFPDGRKP